MIARAGAGACIPSKELTSEKLAGAITMALSREVQAKAEAMGDSIRSETGSVNGANSFLASVEEMGLGRCDLLPNRVAVWTVKGTNIKLSALAATILVEANIIDHGFKGLRLFRHKEWRVDKGPTDPISGGAGAILGTMGSVMMGVGDFPREIFKAISKKDKGKEQSSTPGTPIQENRSTESFATVETSKTNDTVLSPTSISRTGSHSTGTDKGKEKQGQGSGLDMASALTGSKAVSKIVGATLRCTSPFHLLVQLLLTSHSTSGLYSRTCTRLPKRTHALWRRGPSRGPSDRLPQRSQNGWQRARARLLRRYYGPCYAAGEGR
jgi:hypothetical protein